MLNNIFHNLVDETKFCGMQVSVVVLLEKFGVLEYFKF